MPALFTKRMESPMSPVFENLKKKEADAYGLVLASAGIRYSMSWDEAGWRLAVDPIDRTAASDTIQKYLAENRGFKTRPPASTLKKSLPLSGLCGAVIILICHAFFNMEEASWAYGSSARHILNGEWFRAVTSLFLHKDVAHLAGNMAGLALFGSGVCMSFGYGAGWLMILLSGAVGNGANAIFYQSGHLSIGASTAVFGAIGILSARRFFIMRTSSESKTKPWLPMAAGVALLGFLGAGNGEGNTDVSAHLFGFLAGIPMGFFCAAFIKRPLQSAWQPLLALVASGVVMLSWMMAP